jgi:Spy/CpxP family protein refolding chaperone
MKSRWHLIGVALITLSLFGALTAYGHGRRGHHFGHEGAGFPFRVLKDLDLTTEQQTQIDGIWKTHRETIRPLWSELRTIRTDITNKLLSPGEVTAADFTQQTERVAQLEAQLFRERLAAGVEVRNVLTPDQLTKAAEIMAKKQALRAEQKDRMKADQ